MMAIAVRARDLKRNTLHSEGKTTMTYKGVTAELSESSLGFKFERRGTNATSGEPYACFLVTAKIPVEWVTVESDLSHFRNALMIAIALQNYNFYIQLEDGDKIYLRHQELIVELVRVYETSFILQRRPELQIPESMIHTATGDEHLYNMFYPEMSLHFKEETESDIPHREGNEGEDKVARHEGEEEAVSHEEEGKAVGEYDEEKPTEEKESPVEIKTIDDGYDTVDKPVVNEGNGDVSGADVEQRNEDIPMKVDDIDTDEGISEE
ncbi:uncharacterized protein LOC122507650 [Leptopilina heterotoma]|uniref:uncharacterized protein LOC122507650 n=1 Tax=Leptopilina heterotoma TaxID=63436 RepID=UPI001CA8D0CD|nr:uncharacterized protein LOC122507650 [Leptopilina heterotoma]